MDGDVNAMSSSNPGTSALQRNSSMTRSPRRGKGRSTAKFNSSFKNTNWIPEPRRVQPSLKRYQSYGRRPKPQVLKYESLAQFKMSPCVQAENKPRPFMGTCCNKCFPLSRAAAVDQRVFCLSVYNVLNVPFFQRFDTNAILTLFKKNRKSAYPNVQVNVFHNERISQAVKKTFKCISKDSENLDFNDFKNSQLNCANEVVSSLQTSISTTLLQFSSLLFQNLLKRFFDGILVHKGQMEILKSTSQDDIPVIYLPLCQSHLDYFFISFILHMNSLKVPLIAIDSHLYIPFIGYILKFLGAFFINKALKCDKKDHLYSALLESYFSECLKTGHNMEIAIENYQDQSILKAYSSLLKVAMELVLNENLEDVNISVISISYEKLLLSNYTAEQLGQPKPKENILSKIYSLWKVMHFNFGNIRFNFGQPFSIKEHLKNCERKSSYRLPDTMTPPSSSDESSVEISHLKMKMPSFIDNLNHHIVYDATNSISLMSTQLVAFLFVTQYRKGATQQQLQSSLDWLRGELLAKKRDVGFTGESSPVIRRAVDFLGKQLVSTETVDMEWTSSDLENNNVKITVYKPVINLPHVLELQFYANSVVPVFLLDSIIVNALYALVDVEICHFRHCDSKLFVRKDQLIDKAAELSEILQFEFIVAPPCSDITLCFGDCIDKLIAKECLHSIQVGVNQGNARYNRKPHHLSFESDDDEEEITILKEQQLKIDLMEESINHLEFLRNVLSPFIESYWLAACTLLKLVDDIKEETSLIQEMQLTAQDKLYKGLLTYEESFSADTFKNTLKLFKKWLVLEECMQDGIKIICLSDKYNCNEHIIDIIAKIEQFRK